MIKAIVLDLGGVYFTDGTIIALKKIYKLVDAPKKSVDEVFKASPHKEGFLYRTGKLTGKEFWELASKKLNLDRRTVPKLRDLWFSSYKPNRGMKELVTRLKKKYEMIVFSGNIRDRVNYLDRKYKFKKIFDKFIFSFDIGFNKDQPESYGYLLRKVGCKPNEFVYIDDKPEFLKMARSVGINGILFSDARTLKKNLRDFGVDV